MIPGRALAGRRPIHCAVALAAAGSLLGIGLAAHAQAFLYVPGADSKGDGGGRTGPLIQRYDNDGGHKVQGFIQPGGTAAGIAVTDKNIYWLTPGRGFIGVVNIDGTKPDDDFLGTYGEPSSLWTNAARTRNGPRGRSRTGSS